MSRVLVQCTAPLACGCVSARSHTQSALARRVTRSRATHCPACMRLAPSPWHRHSLRSRGLPHTRMPSHAHASPALKSCPSACRQHTGPGLCQCLQRGRCRCQPRRSVTRGLLWGRVPAVLRGHHRVFWSEDEQGGIGGRRTSEVFVKTTKRVERDTELFANYGTKFRFPGVCVCHLCRPLEP